MNPQQKLEKIREILCGGHKSKSSSKRSSNRRSRRISRSQKSHKFRSSSFRSSHRRSRKSSTQDKIITDQTKNIKDVLEQVHPDLKIKAEASKEINTIITKAARMILANYDIFKSLDDVIYTTISGELGKHAKSEAIRADTRYQTTGKTGLIFDIFTQSETSIKLTAVMEYLAAELLELSGNITRDRHAVIVTHKDLQQAIAADNELRALVGILGINI
jgi:hypothetical protein